MSNERKEGDETEEKESVNYEVTIIETNVFKLKVSAKDNILAYEKAGEKFGNSKWKNEHWEYIVDHKEEIEVEEL